MEAGLTDSFIHLFIHNESPLCQALSQALGNRKVNTTDPNQDLDSIEKTRKEISKTC